MNALAAFLECVLIRKRKQVQSAECPNAGVAGVNAHAEVKPPRVWGACTVRVASNEH